MTKIIRLTSNGNVRGDLRSLSQALFSQIYNLYNQYFLMYEFMDTYFTYFALYYTRRSV